MPTALFHGGFGLLTHRQIKKPTYHLYAFMARLGDEVLARGADHLVTRHADGRVAVLAWAPVDVDRRRAPVARPAPGWPCRCRWARAGASSAFLLRSSVSEEAGNAWAAWSEMGRPRLPPPRPARHPAGGRRAGPLATAPCRSPPAGSTSTSPWPGTRSPWSSWRRSVDETPPWWDEARLLGGPTERTPPPDRDERS